MNINEAIKKEMTEAQSKYGHFNSTHEAYAVLKEEVEEFWEVIRNIQKVSERNTINWNSPNIKKGRMISELIQVSAVAKRIAIELTEDKIKHV